MDRRDMLKSLPLAGGVVAVGLDGPEPDLAPEYDAGAGLKEAFACPNCGRAELTPIFSLRIYNCPRCEWEVSELRLKLEVQRIEMLRETKQRHADIKQAFSNLEARHGEQEAP